MKYLSIASGSKGNCGLVIAEKTNILIDIGMSFKHICESLATIELTIYDIDAIIITHEHSDHIKAITQMTKKTNIPIYITEKSLNSALKKYEFFVHNINIFTADDAFFINNIKIESFKTPHDSDESVGFKIYENEKSMAYVTDLGFVPNIVFNKIKSADFVVLESNYDHNMLVNGSYPFSLKKRILSTQGHLSNVDSSAVLINLFKNDVKKVLLAHLSENNNTHLCVKEQVVNLLKWSNLDFNFDEHIFIAPVKCADYIIEI